MPFYKRFGFFQTPDPWKDEKGNEHPTGCLIYHSNAIKVVRSILKRRGIRIEGNYAPIPSRGLRGTLQRKGWRVEVKIEPIPEAAKDESTGSQNLTISN